MSSSPLSRWTGSASKSRSESQTRPVSALRTVCPAPAFPAIQPPTALCAAPAFRLRWPSGALCRLSRRSEYFPEAARCLPVRPSTPRSEVRFRAAPWLSGGRTLPLLCSALCCPAGCSPLPPALPAPAGGCSSAASAALSCPMRWRRSNAFRSALQAAARVPLQRIGRPPTAGIGRLSVLPALPGLPAQAPAVNIDTAAASPVRLHQFPRRFPASGSTHISRAWSSRAGLRRPWPSASRGPAAPS